MVRDHPVENVPVDQQVDRMFNPTSSQNCIEGHSTIHFLENHNGNN